MPHHARQTHQAQRQPLHGGRQTKWAPPLSPNAPHAFTTTQPQHFSLQPIGDLQHNLSSHILKLSSFVQFLPQTSPSMAKRVSRDTSQKGVVFYVKDRPNENIFKKSQQINDEQVTFGNFTRNTHTQGLSMR